MSKRDLTARELEHLSEPDLEKLLETALPTLAAESALAKDWLNSEEDAAWADL